MKSYLKLVNFELGRFIKVYLALIGITIASQLIGTFLMTQNYILEFEDAVYMQGLSNAEFLEMRGQFSLSQMFGSSWYVLPIVFAAAALIFYCFFIWYRDWFGKNTFIYRLLMLPTARLNIFMSKATAIFLMVLGLVALQVMLLFVGNNIMKSVIPANLRTDLSINEAILNSYDGLYLGLLLPGSLIEFLIHYGIGFTFVFILFTAILFERSYRLKGLFFGVLYSVFTVAVLNLTDILVMIYQRDILYPIEMLILDTVLWMFVTALSIWISHYLLNNKVRV